MMKKMIAGVMLAAAVTVLGTTTTFAEETGKVEAKGIAFEIPEELKDLVTVKYDSEDPNTIVSVFETASVEAAKAQGEENEGAGWIFSISTVPESEMKKLRCGGMDGMDVFAEDDDIYYVYNHPTDVRFVREQYDDVDADMEQFTKINEWAFQEVRQEILANNPELDEEFFTNTNLDMHLAQAAFDPQAKFALSSLDFGEEPLDPSALDDNDFIEDLANDATYEEIPDAQAPDGEYYVLTFDEGDSKVRYDFFQDPDAMNLIREVRTVGGEEYETFYQANFKDADDADKTATGIVKEWCEAIANGGEDD